MPWNQGKQGRHHSLSAGAGFGILCCWRGKKKQVTGSGGVYRLFPMHSFFQIQSKESAASAAPRRKTIDRLGYNRHSGGSYALCPVFLDFNLDPWVKPLSYLKQLISSSLPLKLLINKSLQFLHTFQSNSPIETHITSNSSQHVWISW